MAFFASAIDTLKILVIALGAGLGAWGYEWLDTVCSKVWIDSGKILIKGRIALAADH